MFSDMEARMKELETAITRASNYHLDVCPNLGVSPADKDPAAEQLADSLGALSINDTGDTQYYGPSAGTEVCKRLWCNAPLSYPSGAPLGQ
jgi:hypothetical protein